MDPVPDPLLLRKSGSAGNRTRDLCICSQKLCPLDHRGGQKKITFYFVEEGPGRGSEDIKEECKVSWFNFSFFPVSLMAVVGGKITKNLKELH